MRLLLLLIISSISFAGDDCPTKPPKKIYINGRPTPEVIYGKLWTHNPYDPKLRAAIKIKTVFTKEYINGRPYPVMQTIRI